MVGITVVVPTIGRPTLISTLASIGPQLSDKDAVVIVGDGEQPSAERAARLCRDKWPHADWLYITDYGGSWGHPLRNYAFTNYVNTSHVWTIDDDDAATPDALSAMREHLEDPWTIFRMKFGPGHFAYGLTCWRNQKIELGDIGTPMIFAPLSDARFGASYTGDYSYATQLQQLLGDPVWCEDVVAIIRPIAVEES